MFETELVDGGDGVLDDAVGGFDAEPVEEEVRTVAVVLLDVVAVVEVVVFVENRALFIGEGGVVEIFGGFSGEDLLVWHKVDLLVAADEGIGAGGDMHVAAFIFAGLVEEVVQHFPGGVAIHFRGLVEDGPSLQPGDFLFRRLFDFRLPGGLGRRRGGGRGGRHGNRRGGGGRARFQRRDVRRRGRRHRNRLRRRGIRIQHAVRRPAVGGLRRGHGAEHVQFGGVLAELVLEDDQFQQSKRDGLLRFFDGLDGGDALLLRQQLVGRQMIAEPIDIFWDGLIIHNVKMMEMDDILTNHSQIGANPACKYGTLRRIGTIRLLLSHKI